MGTAKTWWSLRWPHGNFLNKTANRKKRKQKPGTFRNCGTILKRYDICIIKIQERERRKNESEDNLKEWGQRIYQNSGHAANPRSGMLGGQQAGQTPNTKEPTAKPFPILTVENQRQEQTLKETYGGQLALSQRNKEESFRGLLSRSHVNRRRVKENG